MEELIRLDGLAKERAKDYPLKRYIYPHLRHLMTETRQLVGVAGLRGAGKTILLRQLAVDLNQSFYISADTLPVGTDLFELCSHLEESFGVRYLMIDEIHAVKDWRGFLKKIYDFLRIRVIFTSSSSLELNEGKYDLSRRLTLIHLPLFSFREYLYFSKKAELPVLSLDEILLNHKKIYSDIYTYEPYFRTYSIIGALPACLESPLPSIIVSTVDKVLQKDMLTVGKLSQEDIHSMHSVLLFIARAGIEGCSYSSISRNAGLTKYKAQQYVSMMEAASILKVVLPYGATVLPEPKLLLAPTLRPALAQGIDEDRLTGAILEEFFIHHISGANLNVNYLKSMRGQKLPDYILFTEKQKYVIEIGGAGKSAAQFKGVHVREKIVLSQPGSKNNLPLILFGFLW